MKKKSTSKESTAKKVIRVFSRKDFLRLLSKDKDSAYQYYMANIIPYAHRIAIEKITCSKTRAERVRSIVQKAWERIGEFRKSKAETIFHWFKALFDHEMTLNIA